jgi:membrane-associated phospholipid phosphatase
MNSLQRNASRPKETAPGALSAGQRLLRLVVLLVAQSAYVPINRIARGGVVLATPWDAAIPLWPMWVIPYLLGIGWWIAFSIWAALEMDDGLYRAFVAGGLAVMIVSYAVYLLYPTYVQRPTLTGDDWPTRLMRLVYGADRAYNAFPSGHTYNSVFIALFWCRWRPRGKLLWTGLALIVLLSTLFTGQHNLPDLAAGALLAWLGYRFGLWWLARRSKGT